MKAKMGQSPAINPNPVLSVRKDGTVLCSNEAGKPLLHDWGVEIGGKLHSNIGDLVQRVISENNPEKMEVKVGKRVYLVVFHPLPEQECVNVSGFNISDRNEIEEKPRESEEKYQEFFNLIEQAVQIGEIVFDEKGQPIDNIILDVNLAYEKHSGLRREQVIGRHIKEIFPIVEQIWLDRYGKVVRTGMGVHFEEYNSSLDKWFEVFASPMGGNRFIAVFSDITDRKQAEDSFLQSEQHYRLLYETMLQGVVYQDASGRIISMNPAAERILGKTPAEFLGSSSVGEEYLTIRENGSPFPGLEHPAMVSLRTGQKVQDMVMGVYNPREKCYRWININAIPIFRTGECKPSQVYTLFDDITERQQEEHRMLRYNRILKGINLIFSNVVQAKTEEELGNACLSVALEVTGSHFGFINEMGADGLLHDVAKSELGWEQCLMDDKTGHRRPTSDLVVHGLYGSVIINEKSFFTNDPQSHPDSIGLPQGYPPLTSFLGVPLILDGKTVGLIAVANREGGYSLEQQEDLEAIAPAMMQALQRKREEQERKQAEEALSRERSLLESVIQTTDVMLALLDPQFNFLWVNPSYAETCQMKPEEIVGKNHFTLYPNAENEAIFQMVRDIGKEVFYKDKPFVFPDQPERGVTYWDWSLVPVKDSCGDVKGLVFSLRETTKYKQVEEALRQSEERLRLLGDNLPDSAVYQYVYEPDGSVRFLYFSTGIERLNGVNVQDVLRDPDTLYRQVPQEYLERIFEAEARSARELSDFDMETPMQLPDGQMRWMRMRSRPHQLPDGRIIWNGVQIDITEHKQAEEALKKARETLEEKVKERTAELENAYDSLKEIEEGLADAQKMAHIGNWDNDLVNGELHWSEEMYRIFGCNPQESITYNKFLSCVHPDDGNYVYNSTKEAFDGKTYATNYRIVRPDGEERIVHSEREVIFDERNNPVRMKGTVQDITEYKKAEEKIHSLANIVESSSDAIGTLSLDGIITSWNRGAEQIYGYSVEEVLGKSVSILAPPLLHAESKKLTEMVIRGEKIHQYETLRLRKDGKIIYVSIVLSPVFDIYGKLTAISFIVRDITERKEAEESLAKIEIARKQEIHHRIKNNLQVISSLLDLQAEKFKGRKDIKDSEVLEAFRESQDRVISMALIHEELYKGGGFETLNFSSYIEELTENLFHTYKLEDTDISLNMDIEENIFFDMDTAVPLGIIVNELVTNSLKHAFSGRDKGEIRIKLHREENVEYKSEGCKSKIFILSVSDNGIGIPENLDIEDLDSLGFQLIISLVDQLDGKFELKRNNGTELVIRFTVTENE
jgi:PAS domain S-box-containing protein